MKVAILDDYQKVALRNPDQFRAPPRLAIRRGV